MTETNLKLPRDTSSRGTSTLDYISTRRYWEIKRSAFGIYTSFLPRRRIAMRTLSMTEY